MVEGSRYEIAVRGQLARTLGVMFEGMELRSSGPNEICMVGEFQDQPALQGFLAHVGDLGLELATVRRLADDESGG
jgi:hypothetical protein